MSYTLKPELRRNGLGSKECLEFAFNANGFLGVHVYPLQNHLRAEKDRKKQNANKSDREAAGSIPTVTDQHSIPCGATCRIESNPAAKSDTAISTATQVAVVTSVAAAAAARGKGHAAQKAQRCSSRRRGCVRLVAKGGINGYSRSSTAAAATAGRAAADWALCRPL